MTASYVLVTAAAVIVVEAIAIGVLLPNYLAGQDLNNRVVYTAGSLAEQVGIASLSSTAINLPSDFALGQRSNLGPGKIEDDGQGLVVPQVERGFPEGSAPLTVALLLSTDGVVLSSSYPQHYPVGSSMTVLPAGAKTIQASQAGGAGAVGGTSTGMVEWAVQPVRIQLAKSRGVVLPGIDKNAAPAGWVYVQAPLQPFTFAFGPNGDNGPLLGAGVVVLLLALPVGGLFGVVSTRGMVRRLRALTRTTSSVAEGDFAQRVIKGSGDELGQLELNFNEMAERLESAVSRERALADKNARQAERNRISRELHDSISQDLFSISLLAAGLEKALPQGSPVRAEVHTLAATAEATNREMRALLLELRPASLEEKGLTAALEELASAYSARLGLTVNVDLETFSIPAAIELAMLRIAQEALANAAKHSRATMISLTLHRLDGAIVLSVTDDGLGFEPNRSGGSEGFGLKHMSDRAAELGAKVTIASEAGKGTIVSAEFPVPTS